VTLIELMIAMVLAVLIGIVGYTVFQNTHRTSLINEASSDLHQNARVAMDLIARDLRMAAFGIPGSNLSGLPAGCPSAITPGDERAGSDLGPDRISMVIPEAFVTGSGTQVLVSVQQAATTTSPAPYTFTVNDATPLSGLAANPPVTFISFGGKHSGGLTALSGSVLSTQENPLTMGQIIAVNTRVYRLSCVTYAIGRGNGALTAIDAASVTATSALTSGCGGESQLTPAGSERCLLRAVGTALPVMVLDGVEDLQFAYACDGCTSADTEGNGVIDDQAGGVANQFDCYDFLPNNQGCDGGTAGSVNTPVPAGASNDTIRLVRASVVARAKRADPEPVTGKAGYLGPAAVMAEDHSPASDTSYNASVYPTIRRQVLTRTVQLRNLVQ
jgi:type IV pilus assembly protein PilW